VTVAFVPTTECLNETAQYLLESGFHPISQH